MNTGYVRPTSFIDKLANRVDSIVAAEKAGHSAVMEYELQSLKTFLARDTVKETERIAEAAKYWRRSSKAHAAAWSDFSRLSISGMDDLALMAGEVVKDLADRKTICEMWLTAAIDDADEQYIYRQEVIRAFADDEQAARDDDIAQDQALISELRGGW
jgi:hypothetical protein